MQKYRETVSYVLWGVVTTMVNYAVYFACRKLFLIYYLVNNMIVWIVAVVFADIEARHQRTWHVESTFRRMKDTDF